MQAKVDFKEQQNSRDRLCIIVEYGYRLGVGGLRRVDETLPEVQLFMREVVHGLLYVGMEEDVVGWAVCYLVRNVNVC